MTTQHYHEDEDGEEIYEGLDIDETDSQRDDLREYVYRCSVCHAKLISCAEWNNRKENKK
jgi:hypothetical protein